MTAQGQYSQRSYLAKSPFAFFLHTLEDTGSSWEQFPAITIKLLLQRVLFSSFSLLYQKRPAPLYWKSFLQIVPAGFLQVHFSFTKSDRAQSSLSSQCSSSKYRGSELLLGRISHMAADLALKGFCPISEILISPGLKNARIIGHRNYTAVSKNQMATSALIEGRKSEIHTKRQSWKADFQGTDYELASEKAPSTSKFPAGLLSARHLKMEP